MVLLVQSTERIYLFVSILFNPMMPFHAKLTRKPPNILHHLLHVSWVVSRSRPIQFLRSRISFDWKGKWAEKGVAILDEDEM